MTTSKLSLVATIVLLLTACGGAPEKEEKSSADEGWCKFDDGKTAAPDFFCTGDIEGFTITGMGSAAKSNAGMNYMVQQAALAARVQLAQNIRTQVSAMVKDYLGSTGTGDAETIDKAASTTSKSITDESLMGSRIVRRIVGPAGEVYVWVAIDEENLVAKSQIAIKTSMQNEQALWQKFQAKKSHEEMAQEIEEYRKMKMEN